MDLNSPDECAEEISGQLIYLGLILKLFYMMVFTSFGD